jgi:hypothetical protein
VGEWIHTTQHCYYGRHNAVLYNETKNRQDIASNVSTAVTNKTDLNMPEINLNVNGFGGMKI